MQQLAKRIFWFALPLILVLLPDIAHAAQQSGIPAVTMTRLPDGGEKYSLSLQMLFISTALAFLPTLLLMMTSFTRIIIVLAILRQALGMPTSPSNQILIGLALFLTFFIMAPVANKINTNALQPYLNDKMTITQALKKAEEPVAQFMLAQTRKPDLALFMKLGNEPKVEKASDIPFTVLVPAFLTSELKTAFEIGFLIFLPFLVIDIVIASVLMSMGMMMLSPMLVSLPFKIMLFVLINGWTLIIGSLAASYGL